MIKISPLAASLVLASTLTIACASGPTPVYIAPTSQTIEARTEMTFSGDGHALYVLNNSSVPILVTGLSLYDCENIKNRCEAQRLRVQVPPHQRVILATVRPDNTSRPSSFHWRYTWEPAHDQ